MIILAFYVQGYRGGGSCSILQGRWRNAIHFPVSAWRIARHAHPSERLDECILKVGLIVLSMQDQVTRFIEGERETNFTGDRKQLQSLGKYVFF